MPLADKKPAGGARDIGDLKARLGLKPARAPAAGQAPSPAGYPGQTGAPVPPPPGFGPPPGPAQPLPPDLTRDPFAVASAPVAQPKVDFVIPKEWDAAAPVDSERKKSATPKILLFVGIPVAQGPHSCLLYSPCFSSQVSFKRSMDFRGFFSFTG